MSFQIHTTNQEFGGEDRNGTSRRMSENSNGVTSSERADNQAG